MVEIRGVKVTEENEMEKEPEERLILSGHAGVGDAAENEPAGSGGGAYEASPVAAQKLLEARIPTQKVLWAAEPSDAEIQDSEAWAAATAAVHGNEVMELDEEDLADYKEGGYHPCQIGDLLKDGRYEVIRKLGWGYFSTVWLAHDRHNNNAYVAVKLMRAAQNYMETALDEIELLKRVSSADPEHPGRSYVVTLHDHFIHTGPNGAHVCMVFEVLGENLLSLMKRYNYKGVPRALVKQITKQVLLGLDYLHRKCGVIHTDIKPENVLIKIYDVDRVVKEVEAAQRLAEEQEERTRLLKEKQSKLLRARYKSIAEQGLAEQGPASPERQVAFNAVAETEGVSVATSELALDEKCAQCRISNDEDGSKLDCANGDCIKQAEAKASQGRQSKPGKVAMRQLQKSNGTPVTGSQPLPSPLKRPDFMLMSNDALLSSAMSGGSQGSRATNSSAGSVASANSIISAASSNPSLASGSVSSGAASTLEGSSRGGSIGAASSGAGSHTDKHVLTHGFTALDDERVTVKIADFGNACWIDHHFTNDIQTRQYRAPEVLTGNEWGASVDCWSAACMIFELLSADYLFEPQSSQTYSKDEDHLAQIIELLGTLPPDMVRNGRYSAYFFNSRGELRNIHKLKEWVLLDVFVEKYGYSREEAQELCDLLLPLLSIDPSKRADSGSMLASKWLENTEGMEKVVSPRVPRVDGSDIPGWDHEAEKGAGSTYSEQSVKDSLKLMLQGSGIGTQ